MDDIKQMLVFHIGHLGDTIMIVPSLWALRRAFPNAEMTLLTDEVRGSGFVNAAELFEGSPFFRRVITFRKNPSGKCRHFVSMAMLAPKLKLKRFDAVAYLTPSLREPIQIKRDRSFFRSLGIKRLFGFEGFDAVQPGMHESLRILRRLEVDGIPAGPPCFDLMIGAAEEAALQRLLQLEELSIDSPMVAVAPFSKMQSKRWPIERYAALIQRLMDRFDIFPVVLGGKDEFGQAKLLTMHWGTGLNAAGLPVRLTAALLHRCAAYIGNDTGAMHLAAAVGLPCLAIFSARDERDKWHPYGEGHIVLRRDVHCAGCRLKVCRHRTCLMRITLNEAETAAVTLLERVL